MYASSHAHTHIPQSIEHRKIVAEQRAIESHLLIQCINTWSDITQANGKTREHWGGFIGAVSAVLRQQRVFLALKEYRLGDDDFTEENDDAYALDIDRAQAHTYPGQRLFMLPGNDMHKRHLDDDMEIRGNALVRASPSLSCRSILTSTFPSTTSREHVYFDAHANWRASLSRPNRDVCTDESDVCTDKNNASSSMTRNAHSRAHLGASGMNINAGDRRYLHDESEEGQCARGEHMDAENVYIKKIYGSVGTARGGRGVETDSMYGYNGAKVARDTTSGVFQDKTLAMLLSALDVAGDIGAQAQVARLEGEIQMHRKRDVLRLAQMDTYGTKGVHDTHTPLGGNDLRSRRKAHHNDNVEGERQGFEADASLYRDGSVSVDNVYGRATVSRDETVMPPNNSFGHVTACGDESMMHLSKAFRLATASSERIIERHLTRDTEQLARLNLDMVNMPAHTVSRRTSAVSAREEDIDDLNLEHGGLRYLRDDIEPGSISPISFSTSQARDGKYQNVDVPMSLLRRDGDIAHREDWLGNHRTYSDMSCTTPAHTDQAYITPAFSSSSRPNGVSAKPPGVRLSSPSAFLASPGKSMHGPGKSIIRLSSPSASPSPSPRHRSPLTNDSYDSHGLLNVSSDAGWKLRKVFNGDLRVDVLEGTRVRELSPQEERSDSAVRMLSKAVAQAEKCLRDQYMHVVC
jgi:hypothetical protein